MDEAVYKRWWPLHRRAACGEALTPQERVAYEAGLRELDETEVLHEDFALAEIAKKQISALLDEKADLKTRHETLTAQIDALEAALKEKNNMLVGAVGT